ncbi:MAG: hypothetical protein P8L32_06960 [Paracoccaceae bacterium]|nr:hypothetical protein [Paracoccaceae bacterium]
MAYADALDGPWTIYSPGVLDIAQVPFLYEHIASPDVHVDHEFQKLIMYFHGVSDPEPWASPTQSSFLATSVDGVTFDAAPELLGGSYFRAWRWAGVGYAISLAGRLWRSVDGETSFEAGPVLRGLPQGTRHPAVLLRDGQMWVAWSAIGDCPERILIAPMDSSGDWHQWSIGVPQELLRPEQSWEGADLPLEPSQSDIAPAPVHQLRDPAFYSEDGRTYLLYSVAGEAGIGLAELNFGD